MMKRSADFSECRTWRYTLIREWDDSKPRLLWILLNPATADETYDDPTNRRGMGYAKVWGFGSLVFCNLFAYRTANPKEMKAAKDPVGPDNDHHIIIQAVKAKQIMIGWGNHGNFMNRDKEILGFLGHYNLYCLQINKSGSPKHPLYCKADLEPIRFTQPESGEVEDES